MSFFRIYEFFQCTLRLAHRRSRSVQFRSQLLGDLSFRALQCLFDFCRHALSVGESTSDSTQQFVGTRCCRFWKCQMKIGWCKWACWNFRKRHSCEGWWLWSLRGFLLALVFALPFSPSLGPGGIASLSSIPLPGGCFLPFVPLPILLHLRWSLLVGCVVGTVLLLGFDQAPAGLAPPGLWIWIHTRLRDLFLDLVDESSIATVVSAQSTKDPAKQFRNKKPMDLSLFDLPPPVSCKSSRTPCSASLRGQNGCRSQSGIQRSVKVAYIQATWMGKSPTSGRHG